EVAVAEVERVAEPGGVLIDEAEDAVVAAGLDTKLLEIRAERLAEVARDGLLAEVTAEADLHDETFLGRLEPEVELVLDGLPVDGEDLVPRPPAEVVGERAGLDVGDSNGHARRTGWREG